MTDVDRWRQLERVYHETLGKPPAERASYLAEVCVGDATLAREVTALLDLERDAGEFLEHPAINDAAALTAWTTGAFAGRRIGDYNILSLLGTGGMGEVYLAHDRRLGRDVALKLLHAAEAADPHDLRRFEEEARAASILNHPNIVTIYGVGEEGGVAYIAMERVQGRTLRAFAGARPLPVPDVLDIAVQLADALTHAHLNGIVHRDLKPDNVMITADGLVKILDFGVARRGIGVDHARLGEQAPLSSITTRGAILGTVGYMSPEQAAGQPVRPASDQFSLGAILYELATGRRAFEKGAASETLQAIISDEPRPIRTLASDVPATLQHIIERCLAKSPDARFSATRDLAEELRRFRTQRLRAEHARAQWRRLGRVGAVGAVVAVLATAVSWQLWWREPPERTLAILPFTSQSAGEDFSYLGEGMAEALIQRLFGLPHLRVTSRTVALSVARNGESPQAIGRRLGVQTVLAGSLEATDERLRVVTELIDVGTGQITDRHTFERSRQDLVGIQDAIAMTVVQATGLRVPAEVGRHLLERPTSDAQAYEDYLRARHFDLTHEDDYLVARQLLKQAIERDNHFAIAYVLYANTYMAALLDGKERVSVGWPAINRAIDRALALDPTLPAAHATAGWVKFMFDWNWEGAEREFETVLKSPARDVEPDMFYPYALEQWAIGKPESALALIQRARRTNPFNRDMKTMEADYQLQAHHFGEAERLYREAMRDAPDAGPALFGLAELFQRQQRYDDAIAALRRAYIALGTADTIPALATARGERGLVEVERRAAAAEVHILEQASRQTYVSPLLLAAAHARAGDTAEALDLLEAAANEPSAGLVFLRVDRSWNALRTQPRFQAIVDALGLPPIPQ